MQLYAKIRMTCKIKRLFVLQFDITCNINYIIKCREYLYKCSTTTKFKSLIKTHWKFQLIFNQVYFSCLSVFFCFSNQMLFFYLSFKHWSSHITSTGLLTFLVELNIIRNTTFSPSSKTLITNEGEFLSCSDLSGGREVRRLYFFLF